MFKVPVTVKLTETDGNVFAILAACNKASKNAGVHQNDFDEFMKEATSGDYNNLLQTVMKYFEVV